MSSIRSLSSSELQELDALTIRRYLGSLQDRGLKPNTVAIHNCILRALFNWLRRERLRQPHRRCPPAPDA